MQCNMFAIVWFVFVFILHTSRIIYCNVINNVSDIYASAKNFVENVKTENMKKKMPKVKK